MRPSRGRLSLHPRGSVVKSLIWTNVIIFLITGLGHSPHAHDLLKLHPLYIRRFQVWRLVTYMFAHGGLAHILFNMWGLYIFGAPLERRLGKYRFASLYLVSGVVGGAIWLLANWGAPSRALVRYGGRMVELTAPGAVIGASGAVFGVMMAAAMMFPNQVIVLLIPPIPMRLKTFVAAYAAIEVFLAFQAGGGQIAHIAHLGGILGGFLYMHRIGKSRNLIDGVKGWWRRVRAKKRQRDMSFVDEEEGAGYTPNLSAETDRILDKLGRYGLKSLTPEERRTLEIARKRLRDRHR